MRILMLILSFITLLSGCQAESIGIIGGSDGPTAVYVTDENDKYDKDPVRMVRIDGGLYYDTDKESEITARCGNMDGEFKKAVKEEYEVPQNDGESNFSDGNSYQISGEDTIEIIIDDEWEIFEKIPQPADELDYKYCYVLEGRLPNAETDSKYLVLANTKDITFNDVWYVFFGSDFTKMKDICAIPIVDN